MNASIVFSVKKSLKTQVFSLLTEKDRDFVELCNIPMNLLYMRFNVLHVSVWACRIIYILLVGLYTDICVNCEIVAKSYFFMLDDEKTNRYNIKVKTTLLGWSHWPIFQRWT